MSESETPKSICVGIDGSRAALRAVEWAVTEAAARDLPLELVYVISTDFDYTPVADGARIEQHYARDLLHAAREAAVATNDSVKVDTEIVTGHLNPTMSTLSQSAEMMVVGSVGIGLLGELFLGSTAAALAHNSQCPVAIIREAHKDHARSTGPVVVAVDNSPENDAVVGVAMREANIRHADILAVHPWRLHFGEIPDAFNLAAERQRAQELLDDRVDRWQQQFPSVRTNTVTVEVAAHPTFSTSANRHNSSWSAAYSIRASQERRSVR